MPPKSRSAQSTDIAAAPPAAYARAIAATSAAGAIAPCDGDARLTSAIDGDFALRPRARRRSRGPASGASRRMSPRAGAVR